MSLKILNNQNCTRTRNLPAAVQICDGQRVIFSSRAVRLLQLKKEDKLSFAIHADERSFVYFYKDAKGLKLTVSGDSLRVYSPILARQLANHLGFKGHKTFAISDSVSTVHGRQMWYI